MSSSQSDKEQSEEIKEPTQQVEVEEEEQQETATSFPKVGLATWLIKNLKEVGIENPTQIQFDTLKPSLNGQNVIGCAHTGSGKTACFALPILQKLAQDPYGIFALVITPTRELAYQINEQFRTFAG